MRRHAPPIVDRRHTARQHPALAAGGAGACAMALRRTSIAVAALAAMLAPLLLRFHLAWLMANMCIYGWRLDTAHYSGRELQQQTRLGRQFSAFCRKTVFLPGAISLCKRPFEPHVQSRLHLNVTSLSTDPPVYLLDGLISRAECERVLELTEDDLEPGLVGGRLQASLRTNSRVYIVRHGVDQYAAKVGSAQPNSSVGRLSSGVDAYSHQLIKRIQSRLAVLFDVPSEYIDLQRHRTLTGQFFRPHLDFISHRLFVPSGPYVWQVLMYCNDVADDAGGQTRFPLLDLQMRPQMGRALAWPSAFDATLVADTRLVHESVRLKRGAKHALFATISTGPRRLWGGWLEHWEDWTDDRVLAAVRWVSAHI